MSVWLRCLSASCSECLFKASSDYKVRIYLSLAAGAGAAHQPHAATIGDIAAEHGLAPLLPDPQLPVSPSARHRVQGRLLCIADLWLAMLGHVSGASALCLALKGLQRC